MSNQRPSKPIYIPLDRVIVYVPPYSVESMQATQAKIEIKSRIKAIFSKAERTARANRVFHLYTENPHVVQGTLAATRQIGSGSITAVFVKRILKPENFQGHVNLNQDQTVAQKWNAARRSRSNLVSLIKAIPATLQVFTSWLIQPRNLAVGTLTGIVFIAVKLIDNNAHTGEAKAPLQLAVIQAPMDTPEPAPAVVETSPLEQPTDPQEKSPVAQNKAPNNQPVPPLPIAGLPLPEEGEVTPNVEPPANSQPNKSVAADARPPSKKKASVKEPTSIALKGELSDPVEVQPKIAIPISETQAVAQISQGYELARWGDQSQLLAFSGNGLVAMMNGRPVEIEAGQSLPSGEVLKSIDKARSLVVTNRRTIQLTE